MGFGVLLKCQQKHENRNCRSHGKYFSRHRGITIAKQLYTFPLWDPTQQIGHFFTKGFWQTRSRWSLPFWMSITLASQRICVASIRAFSIGPTLSCRITHPWKTTVKMIQYLQLQQGEKRTCLIVWTKYGGLVPQGAVYDPSPVIIRSCRTYLKTAVRGAHLHGANRMFVDK